jgi:hypothetical protein
LTDLEEDLHQMSKESELILDGDLIIPEEKDLYAQIKQKALAHQFSTIGGLKVQGVKAYELDGKGNFVNSKIDETESETD